MPEKRERTYAEHGIDTHHGCARFSGPNTVVVGDTTLTAAQVVIAAGAEPVPLPIDALKSCIERRLSESRVAAGAPRAGRRRLHRFRVCPIAARAVAEVAILNRSAQPLAGFDPDRVDLLVERTRALGVDVRLGHEVTAVRKRGGGFEVEAQTASGRVTVAADLVIHSGGGAPALGTLDLDAAGIAHEHGQLSLDEHLRSRTNPAGFAAGDAAGGPLPLTPVAVLEAHAPIACIWTSATAVLENLLGKSAATVDYTGTPSAVFTLPTLTRVGLLEGAARARGLRFKVNHASAPNWFTARRVNESC